MQTRFLYVILALTATLVSCSVSKDQVPDAHPNAKVYESVINAANLGNSAEALITDSVKAGDEVAKIRLQVSSTTALNYLYILYAADNGTLQPLNIPTTVNGYGTFAAGNGAYSLRIPQLSSFVLDIAVSVRSTSTALNDVYKIWMTDSAGSFTLPAYHRALGPAKVTFMYRPEALPETYNLATLNAGSQSSKNYGSLVSTEGQLAVLDSAQYVKSPASADFRFVTLTGGKKDNNAQDVWLYSPADILSANPAVSGQDDFTLPASGSRTTAFGAYAGTVPFEEVTAADIMALPDPTAQSIQVVAGNSYVFKTEAGKKGVVYIGSIGNASSYGGNGSTGARNIGFTVKVLN